MQRTADGSFVISNPMLVPAAAPLDEEELRALTERTARRTESLALAAAVRRYTKSSEHAPDGALF